MLKKWLLALLLLALPVTAHATIFWDDELEPGATSTANGFFWDGTPGCPAGPLPCNTTSAMTFDTTTKFSGTGSLRENFVSSCYPDNLASQCGGFIDRNHTQTAHLFTRVYFRMSAGFTVNDSAYTKMFRYETNGAFVSGWWEIGCCGSKNFIDGTQNADTVVQPPATTFAGSSGSKNVPTSYNFQDAKWYCVETEVQLNTPGTANGILRAWVTDMSVASPTALQVLSVTDFLMRPTGDNSLLYNIRLIRQTGLGSIWYDKFATGDTRIGCTGSAPADTTPPAPVNPLTVTASSSGTNSLTFTATTDTGGSGLSTYNFRFCTGAACTPRTTLGTAPASATSFVHNNVVASTVYGYSYNAVDGAGNSTAYSSPTVYVTTPAALQRTTLASDDFGRVDAVTLGANWTAGYSSSDGALNALSVVTGRARSTNLSVDAYETYTAIATPDDQWIQMTLFNFTAGNAFPGVVVRQQAGTFITGYECRLGTGTSRIGKWSALGVLTTLITNASDVWQTADVLRCEATGSNPTVIKMYKNRAGVETLVNTYSDSSSPYTTGKTGILNYAGTALVDAQFDDFAMGDFSVPVTPHVTGYSGVTRTQATITYTGSPTWISVVTEFASQLVPIAAWVSGTWNYSQTIINGLSDFIGFAAVNSAGTVEAEGYTFSPVTAAPTDTTAPVLTTAFPMISLPAGTTAQTVIITADESAVVHIDTTDAVFASLANVMSASNQNRSFSFALTGLTNGSATDLYARAQDVAGNTNLSSLHITVTVANSTVDTTPPTSPSNLVATALGPNQVQLSWTASTDASGAVTYHAFTSTDGGVTYVESAPFSGNTTLLLVAPGTSYSFKVRTYDLSLNPSAAFSNVVTLTTPALADIVPPSDMTHLQVVATYRNAALLTSDIGTDLSGVTIGVIEQCQGAGCSNFQQVLPSPLPTYLVLNLASNTTYCWRGKFTDASNNKSVNYSDTVCGTTQSGGITRPRGTPSYQRTQR